MIDRHARLVLLLFLLTASVASAQWHHSDRDLRLVLDTGKLSRFIGMTADAGTLYALASIESEFQYHLNLVRSTDEGESWARMASFPDTLLDVSSMRVLANGELAITGVGPSALGGGILLSDDRGEHWRYRQVVADTDSYPVLGIEWIEGETYVASTMWRMLRTEDGGAHWSTTSAAADGGAGNALRFLRVGNTLLVHALAGGGIFRSTDKGKSWEEVRVVENMEQFYPQDIWTDGSAIYIADGPPMVIRASYDGGATWGTIPIPIGAGRDFMHVETSPDGRLWAMYVGSQLYISTDGGVSAITDHDAFIRCSNAYAVTGTHLFTANSCSIDSMTGIYRYDLSQGSVVTVGDEFPRVELKRPILEGGHARIAFRLAASGDARLVATDLLGNVMATIDEGRRAAGAHAAMVDVSAWPSGAYWISLAAGGRCLSQPLYLTR